MAMAIGESKDRAFEAAMDWLLRVEAAPSDAALRTELEAWCRADPAHARAWARAQKTWSVLGESRPAHVAEWPARRPAAERRLPQSANGGRRRAAWRLGAAAGLAAAAGLFLLVASVLVNRFGADYATVTAELREVALADGSRAHLGPRSAMDVGFAVERRAVALLDGEAFFEVAADAARPFVVRAGGLDVTVVGTAFDVRLSGDQVVVAVRNGSVEVRGASGVPAARRLGAGDRLKVDRATGNAALDKIAPAEVASWRDRRLFVDGATVAEVVGELSRYRTGWIVIGDSRLAERRVTGLFELDDTDRALVALVQPFDGRVQSVTPFLQILSAP